MSVAPRSSEIKPWKTEMVDSNGDYRRDMFLEEHIGGPLYENQAKLPSLPVPSISDSLERFLQTALPLAKTVEEKEALKAACRAFPEQARVLQERLIERKDVVMKDSSFLQLWWNQLGYLQVRDPVVVNVSYFFSFFDDPTVSPTGSNASIQRAATILFASAEFRKLVVTGQLPYEKVGKKQIPLDSTPYKYMFNASRIPRREQDSYRIYDPSRFTHAVVARKGYFFSIEMAHPQTGNPLPVGDLEEQLRQCVQMADSIPNSRPKLGLLTSNNRDAWADARGKLIASGGIAMEEALKRVESGALMICLDDEAPVSRSELGNQYMTGGLKSGNNRWYDKSVSFIVNKNGKAGMNAEHSMMDGMPVINFCNFMTKMTYAEARRKSASLQSSGTKVEDIFAAALRNTDMAVVEQLEAQAWSAFHKLVTDHRSHAQSFQAYGASFVKKSGFPPDAYVQMAMQLATYRLFGEQVGTYEATQVRRFRHGRTEVTRSCTTDSEAFIKMMGLRPKGDENDKSSVATKLALLKKATSTHAKLTGKAASGNGVDRHFFGLAMLVKDGEEMPALFKDPLFIRSKKWRASTSQLSHPRFNLWGYGEVVPDGVGLAYAVLPQSCVFNITALASTGWTDKLSELLEEALLEMRGLVQAGKANKSKL